MKFIVLSLISLKLGPVREEAQLKIRFTMSDRPWRVRRNGLVRPFRQMEKRGEVKNKNMSTKEILMNDIDSNQSLQDVFVLLRWSCHNMNPHAVVLTLIQMLQAIYFSRTGGTSMGRFTTPLSVAVVASVASALRPSTRRSPSIRRAVATETMIKEEGVDEN